MSKTEEFPQSRERRNLLMQMQEAQKKFSYVPWEFMAEMAKTHDISLSGVYGVATFYSFFSRKPLGRNVIRICQSLPCFLKNAPLIIKSVEEETGTKSGESTSDHRFSFELTNCIGACDGAPAMMINDDVHTNLTPQKIAEILKTYK